MTERDFTEIWEAILKLLLGERYVFVYIGLKVGISNSGVHGRLPLPNYSQWQNHPCTGMERPLGFQEVEAPLFPDSRYMKVVRLSDLGSSRFYPEEILPVLMSLRG